MAIYSILLSFLFHNSSSLLIAVPYAIVPRVSVRLLRELNTTALTEMEKMNSAFKKCNIW